jgi:hypothetical protein
MAEKQSRRVVVKEQIHQGFERFGADADGPLRCIAGSRRTEGHEFVICVEDARDFTVTPRAMKAVRSQQLIVNYTP